LYLDLGETAWRAVEIDATGWRVIDQPPVRFRRAAGMQPLPMPVPGGSIDTLRNFLNVQSESDFILVVAWALAVLRKLASSVVVEFRDGRRRAAATTTSLAKARRRVAGEAVIGVLG
jgi:hypothetical protein